MKLDQMSKEELLEQLYISSDRYFNLVAENHLFFLIGTPEFEEAKKNLQIIVDEILRRKTRFASADV